MKPVLEVLGRDEIPNGISLITPREIHLFKFRETCRIKLKILIRCIQVLLYRSVNWRSLTNWVCCGAGDDPCQALQRVLNKTTSAAGFKETPGMFLYQVNF
jgi:hypothetical protein